MSNKVDNFLDKKLEEIQNKKFEENQVKIKEKNAKKQKNKKKRKGIIISATSLVLAALIAIGCHFGFKKKNNNVSMHDCIHSKNMARRIPQIISGGCP